MAITTTAVKVAPVATTIRTGPATVHRGMGGASVTPT
jgi:hypothetical protein